MKTAPAAVIATIVLLSSLLAPAEPAYSGGDGSVEHPYQIATIADWLEFTVAAHSQLHHYILTSDIDFEGAEIDPVGWTNEDPNFYGHFDGQGFAIRNVLIHKPDQIFVGLFSRISSPAEVRNLTIEATSVIGEGDVGGLAGISSGVISDCSVTGFISGFANVGGLVGEIIGTSIISNCSINVSIDGGFCVGGLVGFDYEGDSEITSCDVSADIRETWGLPHSFGGLVGYATGKITDCRVTVSIDVSYANYIGGLVGESKGGYVTTCSAENASIATDYCSYVGGLIGRADSSAISDCFSTGSVSGNYSVGGLVGKAVRSTITRSYSTVAVNGVSEVGGLAGTIITESLSFTKNAVSFCYAAGSVSGTEAVGGLIGRNYAETMTGCIWDTQATGQTASVGNGISDGAEGKTTAWMQALTTFIEAGWLFVHADRKIGDWVITEGNYPKLARHVYSPVVIPDIKGMTQQEAAAAIASAELLTGENFYVQDLDVQPGWASQTSPKAGTVGYADITPVHILLARQTRYSGGDGITEPYEIADLGDWIDFVSNSEDWMLSFILTADINLASETYTKSPVATNRAYPYETDSYYYTGVPFTGIFDGKGHVVSHISLIDPYGSYLGLFGLVNGGQIRNLGLENFHIRGSNIVGGLVGYINTGTLSACYVIGSVNGSGSNIGGLVGSSYQGTVSNCFSAGSVQGDANVGGLIGNNYQNAMISCYASAKPTGNSAVGGLCGYKATGPGYQDTGNFWDTQISTVQTSAMGTGKTTAQMQTLSTFTDAGWDFTDTWAICEGTNYPRLRWQIPAADWVCPDGVRLEDFAHLAAWWLADDCALHNDCDGADLNQSGDVGLYELLIVAEHWLK